LNAKIIDNLVPLHEKIFENITIEISHKNHKTHLTNIYRSPSPNTDSTLQFINKLESLLHKLNSLNGQSFVFSDSNINLLNCQSNGVITDYLDSISNNGFLRLSLKATRIQHSHFSLIDHILLNRVPGRFSTGSIVSDISDHFFTFL
jgi:hypothetical protein